MTSGLITRIKDAEKRIENSNLGTIEMNKYALGPWSPSKLKMAEKCPFQFYLQYILKVKPDESTVIDTSLADIGTTAHRILEHVVLGKSVQEAFRLAKLEHCDVDPETVKAGHAIISNEQWEESVLNLEMSITGFKEKLDRFAQKNNIKKVLTELRLGVTKDWKPTTFFANNVYFRGIIDLLLLIDTGPEYHPDMLIIDHKTGGGEFGGLKNYEQQLDCYKPMVHFAVQKCSGGQSGINFIRADRLVLGDYTDAHEIETRLVQKLEWLLSCAVDNMKELGFFKHIRGAHCTYCAFNEQCKAGDLKQIEKSTEKWFEIKKVE